MKLSATVRRPSPMTKTKSRKKKPPKRVLALPDLEHAKTAVLNSLRDYRDGPDGAGSAKATSDNPDVVTTHCRPSST